ncbi:MAG: hypothetical protein J2P21_27120, partial [Chloracidobacterium sp.]|nr:hypothetical protein [Chloracidobacterium sp.]
PAQFGLRLEIFERLDDVFYIVYFIVIVLYFSSCHKNQARGPSLVREECNHCHPLPSIAVHSFEIVEGGHFAKCGAWLVASGAKALYAKSWNWRE